jgi:hypothetical protein
VREHIQAEPELVLYSGESPRLILPPPENVHAGKSYPITTSGAAVSSTSVAPHRSLEPRVGRKDSAPRSPDLRRHRLIDDDKRITSEAKEIQTPSLTWAPVPINRHGNRLHR